MNCDWKKKGFIELFSSCFLLDLYKRENGAYVLIGSLHLRDSGLMQSHQVAMEKRNQEVFVLPVVGHPASSSSLSPPVCDVLKHSPLLLGRGARCHFAWRIVVDQCLENLFDSASLLSFLLCLLYYFFFLRAFVGGRDDGCVVKEQGGTGFVFCRQLPSSISCHILTYSICGS